MGGRGSRPNWWDPKLGGASKQGRREEWELRCRRHLAAAAGDI